MKKYKILKIVTIRREPHIVEYRLGKAWITNAVGTQVKGDIVEVIGKSSPLPKPRALIPIFTIHARIFWETPYRVSVPFNTHISLSFLLLYAPASHHEIES